MITKSYSHGGHPSYRRLDLAQPPTHSVDDCRNVIMIAFRCRTRGYWQGCQGVPITIDTYLTLSLGRW